MRALMGRYEINGPTIKTINITGPEYPAGYVVTSDDDNIYAEYRSIPGNCGMAIFSAQCKILKFFNDKDFQITFYEYTGYGRILYTITDRQLDYYKEFKPEYYNEIKNLPILFSNESAITGVRSYMVTSEEYLVKENPKATWTNYIQECTHPDSLYKHPVISDLWIPKVKWVPHNA